MMLIKHTGPSWEDVTQSYFNPFELEISEKRERNSEPCTGFTASEIPAIYSIAAVHCVNTSDAQSVARSAICKQRLANHCYAPRLLGLQVKHVYCTRIYSGYTTGPGELGRLAVPGVITTSFAERQNIPGRRKVTANFLEAFALASTTSSNPAVPASVYQHGACMHMHVTNRDGRLRPVSLNV